MDLTPTQGTGGGVTYRVRLTLGPGTLGDGGLAPRPRPGMSAVANLKVRTATDAVAVPLAAVVRDGDADAVWVRSAAGQGRARPVTLGAQGATDVAVTDGLRTGERVVVTGADTVRAGPGPARVTEPPALEAVDVTRTYDLGGATVQALRGVSVRVDQGDYVAVVGPSGSGKSTLMHLLGGLDQPTTGTLRIGGRDVAGLAPGRAGSGIRNGTIGFVFQAFQLLARTTALDNVGMPLVYRGLRRAERRRRAQEALEAVGMGHRLDHTPNRLSGGEQQRVAIARALVGEPQVLLADEPTGNLDTRTGAEVMALLEQLNTERGVAVVLVTHDLEVAGRARRQVHVRDGLIEP